MLRALLQLQTHPFRLSFRPYGLCFAHKLLVDKPACVATQYSCNYLHNLIQTNESSYFNLLPPSIEKICVEMQLHRSIKKNTSSSRSVRRCLYTCSCVGYLEVLT